MPKNTSQVEFRGFIQLPLNESDITVLEKSEASGEQMILWLAQITRNHYKVAIAYDADPKTWKITMQDQDNTRTSGGWMLSAEGQSILDALLTIMYKHDGKMHGDWIPFLDKAREAKRFR